MNNSIRRALRAGTTVAGIVTLGAACSGTALASTPVPAKQPLPAEQAHGADQLHPASSEDRDGSPAPHDFQLPTTSQDEVMRQSAGHDGYGDYSRADQKDDDSYSERQGHKNYGTPDYVADVAKTAAAPSAHRHTSGPQLDPDPLTPGHRDDYVDDSRDPSDTDDSSDYYNYRDYHSDSHAQDLGYDSNEYKHRGYDSGNYRKNFKDNTRPGLLKGSV